MHLFLPTQFPLMELDFQIHPVYKTNRK